MEGIVLRDELGNLLVDLGTQNVSGLLELLIRVKLGSLWAHGNTLLVSRRHTPGLLLGGGPALFISLGCLCLYAVLSQDGACSPYLGILQL